MKERSSKSSHARLKPPPLADRQQAPDVSVEKLLEALPDGVVLVDTQGRIIYANGLLEGLSGYRREELVGQFVELLVPERLRNLHTRHRGDYLANPRARPMGVNLDISLRRKDGTVFPADIALSPLQTSSGMVVVAALRDATERKETEAHLHRLAVLEDRERIARDLHDGVIQGLFAVGMSLQATEGKATDPETVRSRLAGAVESIDVAIRDLRDYIFALRPGVLADRALDQALREVAEEYEEKTGIVIALDIDPRVAAQFGNASAQLLQVTREALSNMARHAGAKTCRVRLVREGDSAVLEIDDDGGGFDPARPGAGGHGLRNMRERAETMGGRLSIESSRAEGTTIRLTLLL